MGDYLFTIAGQRRKQPIFFGRSRLLRFAETLPHERVEVVDKKTGKSLGTMPISLAQAKFA
jgi:hypothetical protein